MDQNLIQLCCLLQGIQSTKFIFSYRTKSKLYACGFRYFLNPTYLPSFTTACARANSQNVTKWEAGKEKPRERERPPFQAIHYKRNGRPNCSIPLYAAAHPETSSSAEITGNPKRAARETKRPLYPSRATFFYFLDAQIEERKKGERVFVKKRAFASLSPSRQNLAPPPSTAVIQQLTPCERLFAAIKTRQGQVCERARTKTRLFGTILAGRTIAGRASFWSKKIEEMDFVFFALHEGRHQAEMEK